MASAETRARTISRRAVISWTRAANTSCARELAHARIIPATEASRVRKTAVVTMVNRKVSAVDTPVPNTAREPSRYAVLPCGSAAEIAVRPSSAVAPNPTTVMTSTNRATSDTAQDSERRTWRALAAVYMRMVTCGRQAPPSTTVSSEATMSSRDAGAVPNCSPERRKPGPAPLCRAAVVNRAPGSQSKRRRTRTATTAPEPSSITIFRIWMSAVPFMPPIAA
ncbi:hypothetical protein GCM10017687_35940 [Streptomyces echinatus]